MVSKEEIGPDAHVEPLPNMLREDVEAPQQDGSGASPGSKLSLGHTLQEAFILLFRACTKNMNGRVNMELACDFACDGKAFVSASKLCLVLLCAVMREEPAQNSCMLLL